MADRHNWRVGISLAVVGIVGAWLGSAVQHFLSLEREQRNAFENRQNAAYVAFLSAFEKYRVGRQERDSARAEELLREYELEAGTAGRRIAVFGDRQVVQAMANWYRAYEPGEVPECDQRSNTELALWVGMRGALLGGDQAVSTDDLAAITTACRPAVGQ